MAQIGVPLSAEEYLAIVLGIKKDQILIVRDLVDSGKAYYQWQVPKTSGGMRDITSPVEELKKVQRCILERILYQFTVHHIAHGFVRGRDIFSNAAAHAGWRSGLNFDLKDAFPSVREHRVRANLSKPLNRDLRTQFGRSISDAGIEEVLELIIKLCVHGGSLPQGTPTSPGLLNVVCLNLDRELYQLAMTEGLTVTRYADDITLTSKADEIPGSVQRRIRATISNAGWKVNATKTKYVCRKGAHNDLEVTGLLVQEDGRVTVPPKRREAYRIYMHHLLEKEEIDDDERARLLGIVIYLTRVYSGHLPSQLRKVWGRLKDKHGFMDAPTSKHSVSVDPYAPPMAQWSNGDS